MAWKKLTVGTNFDSNQLQFFIACNEKYKDVRIDSVYGSLRSEQIDLASARPDFRLGTATAKEFERYVALAREHHIGVDYTANALLTMPVEVLHEKKNEIVQKFKYLESVGVERVIAANPLLMELITDYTGLKIKCSTILGINRVSAIRYYAQYRVDSICPEIYVNRNIPLLAAMQKECENYGIHLELLANEVCMYGNAPCTNVLRTNCYLHSSFGGNEQQHFAGWPFSRCQKARRESPSSILKIPFILPNCLQDYERETGITHFKISGRTNTFAYLSSTVENYMAQTFDGRLEHLFMLPQNTQHAAPKTVSVQQLKYSGFFEKIFSKTAPCDYQCQNCGFCDSLYEKL